MLLLELTPTTIPATNNGLDPAYCFFVCGKSAIDGMQQMLVDFIVFRFAMQTSRDWLLRSHKDDMHECFPQHAALFCHAFTPTLFYRSSC